MTTHSNFSGDKTCLSPPNRFHGHHRLLESHCSNKCLIVGHTLVPNQPMDTHTHRMWKGGTNQKYSNFSCSVFSDVSKMGLKTKKWNSCGWSCFGGDAAAEACDMATSSRQWQSSDQVSSGQGCQPVLARSATASRHK